MSEIRKTKAERLEELKRLGDKANGREKLLGVTRLGG